MDRTQQHSEYTELFIKVLTREATSDEQAELNALLKTSEAIRKELAEFEKVWNLAGKTGPAGDIDIDAEWSRMYDTIVPKTKIIPLKRFISIAASIIVILGLGYVTWSQLGIQTFKTELASIDGIRLPDGSTVSLNANSELSYRRGFGSKHRNLKLHGEGFFEVNKNQELPFIIATSDASVKVVGTKFNVKAYRHDPKIKVTVVEGIVELYNPDEPAVKARIKAGESGSYQPIDDTIKLDPKANINDLAWKTLTMNFENESLEEVCRVLQNTYHYNFILDDKVKNCSITVEFRNQNLKSVLNVLKSTLDLQMTQEGKTIKITGKGCNGSDTK